MEKGRTEGKGKGGEEEGRGGRMRRNKHCNCSV